MAEDGKKLMPLCRTCFRESESYRSLADEVEGDLTISKVLSICVPEVNVQISENPIVCQLCADELIKCFSFKKKCLATEELVTNYLKAKHIPPENTIELYEVIKNEEIVKNPYADTAITYEPEKKTLETTQSNELLPVKQEPAYEGYGESNIRVKDEPMSDDEEDDDDEEELDLLELRLRQEIRRKGNSKPSNCSVCNEAFRSIKELKTHLKTLHPGHYLYKCEVCNRGFLSQSSFNDHKKVHSNLKPFICEQCGQRFEYRSKLNRHLLKHTDEKNFVCELCQKPFSTIEGLRMHKNSHEGHKPFSCEECGKFFARKIYLKYHLRTHKNEKPFSCNMCDKRYYSNGKLQDHLKLVHLNAPPQVCEVCGKGYPSRYTLKNHMKTHNGERNHVCEICKKAFYEPSHLTLHMRGHTGERPYECKLCSKRFTQANCLKSHMAVHNGVKPYKCDLCDKSFYEKSRLNMHRKGHLGEIKCDICQNTFTTFAYLKYHKKRFHSDVAASDSNNSTDGDKTKTKRPDGEQTDNLAAEFSKEMLLGKSEENSNEDCNKN